MYFLFEGTVGTGKTTQSKKLFEYLKNKYPEKEVVWTREPGGTEIAEKIREVVQGMKFDEEMDYVCEAYLYAAARAQSLRKVVKPVLDRGGIVVADRSYVTSVTYQGVARELGIERVLRINHEAVDGITPDVIFYMNIDPEVGHARTFDTDGDKFESMDVEFFRKIDAAYKKLADMDDFKDKWYNIDASGTVDDVFKIITNSEPIVNLEKVLKNN